MIPALVVGKTHATVKDASLVGTRLLIVQPTNGAGKADGFPLIALDAIGANAGDQVMLSSDGPFARDYLNREKTPVRWSIIGLIDQK